MGEMETGMVEGHGGWGEVRHGYLTSCQPVPSPQDEVEKVCVCRGGGGGGSGEWVTFTNIVNKVQSRTGSRCTKL